jgi:DNA-binding transcriptional regulator GbsR (MarR family)
LEAFFAWLLQNVAWDTLKQALPKVKQRDLKVFKQALEDAQNRLLELERDRELLGKIVEQRNRAIMQLTEANRRIKALEAQLRELKRSGK